MHEAACTYFVGINGICACLFFIPLKTFEILYTSLATCVQSHTGRDNGDGSNGKPSLWEISSQLQGRENDVAFPVTRGKMWGKYNIYLRADQCCHKTKQKRIKHRLEEYFQPLLRRGCHPLADGVSLSQVFHLLQLPRVLSAGSPSTSSTGASAWVHLLEPLLRELIQVGIGQKREDGIHLADWSLRLHTLGSQGSLVQKRAEATSEEKRLWLWLDLG